MLGAIPKPPGLPIVGNALSVDASAPVQHMMALAKEHGEIYVLDLVGTPFVVVSGADLVAEVSDESRFGKVVRGPLRKLRAITGNGLFTGDTQDPDWGKAHNILLPTFSQKSMSDYLPMMYDIAEQLMSKWERLNSDEDIDVPQDMIGLTLDTIGLCGFDYRFNSFYRSDFHPFINALTRTLLTTKAQRGLPLEGARLKKQLKQLQIDVEYMNSLVDKIIKERRQNGGQQNDLLNFMLTGKDRVTGEGLSDENIRHQINTFLIAGHETTSGLLSFALYYLLKNPSDLARAYEEVDSVIGRDISRPPTMTQIGQLKYVAAILFEALRLWPTAPSYGVAPHKDEVIGGQYSIPKGTFVSVLVPALHRERAVWGENADEFDPNNFMGEAEANRHPHAYKPFGNGQRACIGRQFAIQEAVLVLSMILQRFELYNHQNYELEIKETLSLKPSDFKMKVKLREGVIRGERAAYDDQPASSPAMDIASRPKHGALLTVLYGSNLGSTESFAREIAQKAEFNGFDVDLGTLDDYVGKLPKKGVVAIACPSYNGGAPDNAIKFVNWLDELEGNALQGVKFATLGCGNSDWAATFQSVPRKIDQRLIQLGAEPVSALTEVDAKEDIDTQFNGWLDDIWPAIGETLGLDVDFTEELNEPPLYTIEVTRSVIGNPVADQIGAIEFEVLRNDELQRDTNGNDRSTRHIELKLPEGVSYQPGDHLCVVPKNRPDVIRRLMDRFQMKEDTYIRIESRSEMRGPFPSGSTFSVQNLAECVGELQAVATRKDLHTLAKNTRCPDTKKRLNALAAPENGGVDLYRDEIFQKRLSILNLLEKFPACELPFSVFLEMAPFMSPRFYSISSDHSYNEGTCSITVGVVEGNAYHGDGLFQGTCSNYLSELKPGDRVKATIRQPSSNFRPPKDPTKPIIMIGPGTGLAPFRGFLQSRAVQSETAENLGKAKLFFGCRHPSQDFLYETELREFEKRGLVDLHLAFSRDGDEKTYVQDLIEHEAQEIREMVDQGAIIYVCGDGARMEPQVRETLARILAEKPVSGNSSGPTTIDGLAELDRYLLDVWVG